jgi:putative phosphotransacetylase
MSHFDEASLRALVKLIVDQVHLALATPYISVGVSNRHIHLSQEDLDILFGAPLTPFRQLLPGHYAAKETVTIHGPKGAIERVRILGPTRPFTQLEVSVTDSFALGIKAPIAESGDLSEATEISITNPLNGASVRRKCAIAALRHIHMGTDYANRYGFFDKEIVSVEFTGNSDSKWSRGLTFNNTLVRISPDFTEELHIDMDEANAAGVSTGDIARIIKNVTKSESRAEIATGYNHSGPTLYKKNVLSAGDVMSLKHNGILDIGSKVLVTDLAKETATRLGIKLRRVD